MRKPVFYSSAYDGGRLLTEFEETGKETTEDGGKEITEDGGSDEIPTRSQGEYAATNNPRPRDDGRDEGKESKAMAEVHKKKAVFYPKTRKQVGPVW